MYIKYIQYIISIIRYVYYRPIFSRQAYIELIPTHTVQAPDLLLKFDLNILSQIISFVIILNKAFLTV